MENGENLKSCFYKLDVVYEYEDGQSVKISECHPSTSTCHQGVEQVVFEYNDDGEGEPAESDSQECSSSTLPIDDNDESQQKSYVDIIRDRYHHNEAQNRSRRRKQTRMITGTDVDAIRMRLVSYGCEVDVNLMSCTYPMCGRVFASLDVLAYHASYAHQDLMSIRPQDVVCLICGRLWSNVKCKVVHISAKHRELCDEHNAQCVVQVNPVIAPNAPKAQRIMQMASQNNQLLQYSQLELEKEPDTDFVPYLDVYEMNGPPRLDGNMSSTAYMRHHTNELVGVIDEDELDDDTTTLATVRGPIFGW